ncbi:MAG: hypothetical protein R3B45_16625 [Bdellovibrionota bacterium]
MPFFTWQSNVVTPLEKSYCKLDLSKIEVIAPDLLNLGLSDALNKSDFNLKNHANSIAELIDALNLENITPYTPRLGWAHRNIGSFSVRTPVKRLIILNTGLKTPAAPFKISKFHSFVNKKILPDLAFKIFRFPMYSLHKTQANRETLKGNKAEIYRYPMKRYSRWNSALLFARMVPTYAEHPSLNHFEAIETYCKNFENNAEIIWGIKDPIMGRSLNSIQKLLPNARTTKLHAGHFLQEEKPDEIAHCIMQIQ